MASNPTLDPNVFKKRVETLYKFWTECNSNDPLKKADCLIFMNGTDEIVYSKTLSIQTWLFGYELTDSILVFSRESICFLSSKRKCDFLAVAKDVQPHLKLLIREKADKDAANFQSLKEVIERCGNVVGHIAKDKTSNEFLSAFKSVLKSSNFEMIDVSASVGNLLAVKDESEIALIKKAAEIANNIFLKYLRDQIVDAIDKEKKIKHSKLSAMTDAAVKNKRYNLGVEADLVDMSYPCIVQSGARFALKYSAEVDEENLHFGVIVCMLGVRFSNYCANVIRSLMVNPTSEQQRTYEFVNELMDLALETLRPGVVLSEVYQVVLDRVRLKRPELEEKMVKNVGFVVGIEFRDSTLMIGPKTQTVSRSGMTFVINIGFENILNPDAQTKQDKTYALFISDTVLVRPNDAALSLTLAKRHTKGVTIFIKEQEDADEEEEEEKDIKITEVMELSRGHRRAILDTKTRQETTSEDKRGTNQMQLFESLMEEARARLSGVQHNEGDKKRVRSSVAYKSSAQLPRETDVRALRLVVDRRYEALILPVFGYPTPFHISTIKNVASSIEGDYTYLRINFFHPGATIAKDGIQFEDPEATFVREITFRASNERKRGETGTPSTNLDTAFRLIKEVQKKFKTREAEQREKEDLVEQDSLILSQNRSVPKLKDLYIRPNIVSKRITGNLEAHTNGFRFNSIRGDKVDILYNNIKHAFFQPCDKEMIILLHFHLRNAIMFGKKKHYDVQFYTEVGEITTDLGKAHHMHDRDDIEAEQRERELRNKLKQAFRNFTEKVEAMSKQAIDFDAPFRELGFMGAPFRSTVLLQPTTAALVHLTEWPPFIVSLSDVELVHFERVSLSIRNFDMVFVFKDYHRKVAMINSIPATSLDHVKEWLNSCDIYYSEGVQSLNWVKVMKTITDDIEGFLDGGGWDFLSPKSDSEDETDDEEDEAYQPSDAESGSENSESESSEDESEDWSAEESGSEEEELDSSEESGKDWDELEDEARRADAETGEEVDRGKHSDNRKRKHTPSPVKSSKKHKHGSSPTKKHSSSHKSHNHSHSKHKHGSPKKKSMR